MNEHGRRLYRLLVRLTLREDVAEDLLQDLAVKLCQARGFAAADEPYAYARKTAMNLAFSWLRRRRPRLSLDGFDHSSEERPAWSKLVRAEEIQRVLDRMDELSERDRLILTMRYFDEAGYDEISRVLGTTPKGARGLCHKAIARLRKAVVDAEDQRERLAKEAGS